MDECSAKYKAAQSAGTLKGAKWNEFRKTQLEIALKEDSLMVAVHTDGLGRTIEVSVGDATREIKDGEHYAFPL